jgi:hypothetical protein
MNAQTKALSTILVLAGLITLPATAAFADAISPGINNDDGDTYSSESANSAFFGRGVSGRMSEASYLRFASEQALLEKRYDEAYRKLSKAVQLDPGDPTGHVMLARSMNGVLRRSAAKGKIDEELLAKLIREWKLIAYHDADLTEQLEAKGQLRQLNKIVKALKQKKEMLAKAESEKQKESIEIVSDKAKAAASQLADKPARDKEL